MRRVLRIIAKALSGVAIVLIIIPLLLSIAIRIEFIQTLVVKRLAQFASKKIETKVSIGHISIDGNLDVVVTDFFVQDPNGIDTLLFAHKVSTKIESLGIITDKVVLSNTSVNKGMLYLETDKDKVLNIKRVTDKLKPQNPSDKVFKMIIEDVKIDTFNFRFREYDYPEVEDGINYKNLRLNNISGRVKKLDILNDSISMNILGLNFVERSGVQGKDINMENFSISPKVLLFERGSLKIDSSFVEFQTVKMSYNDWDMSDFINKVPMDISITQSLVDMATVAKFTMRPQKWKLKVAFAGTLNGILSNAKGSASYINTGEVLINGATFSMNGLPNIEKTIFDIKAPEIEATTKGLFDIVDDFSPKGAGKLPKTINQKTKIYAVGSFKGTINDFNTKVTLNTLKNRTGGIIATSLDVKKLKDGALSLGGSIETKDLNLSQFIDNKNIGELSSSLKINSILGNKSFVLNTEGEISKLSYKGYDYNSIKLLAEYKNNRVVGSISSTDKNIDFSLNGEMDIREALPRYNVNMEMRNIDLVKLQINKRDTISKLKGVMKSNISGTSLDNLVGGVLIDSVKYVGNRDTLKTFQDIKLSFNNKNKINQISMRSDFLDADFKGVMGYTNIVGYFMESLRKFMPAFHSDKMDSMFSSKKIEKERSSDNTDNFYMINVDVKESNHILNAIVPGLRVSEKTNMSLIFNPYDDIISIRIKSKNISYKDTFIDGITIDCHNDNEALSLFAKLNSLENGSIFIPNAIFVGSLGNNILDLSARFNNDTDNTEAIIKTSTLIERSKNGNIFDINLKPSSFRIQNMTWRSNDSHILIAPSSIKFYNTNIYNDDQRLNINGIIGNNIEDKITVDLNNFNIETGKFIFQSFGYNITGFLTGEATGYALKNREHRKFESHIEFNEFNINGIALNPGIFDSWWDDSSNSILYTFKNKNKNILTGNYTPTTSMYKADVKIDSIQIALVEPFMKSIFSDVEGSASIDVSLSNPKGYFAIDGVVDIPEFKATVGFTQVPYKISGRAVIKDNQYSMKNGIVVDPEGGKALFTGYMTNEKYKKVKYNFDLHPESMLVMNLSANQNDIFYGKAYATGRVTVNGDRNNVLLDVNAKTAKQSTFFLPLNDKITVSEVDFISFLKQNIEKDVQRSFISSRKQTNELNTRFAISLDLNLGTNLEAEIVVDPITGSSIKTTGNGNLNMLIVPKDGIFTMNGDYTISQGMYRFILPNLNLVDKYFTIKPGGGIRWSGDPLAATLNVEAIYKLKASLAPILGEEYTNRSNVECVLSLRDNLINPTIKLGIEVPDVGPKAQSEIRSMLKTEEDISTQLFFLLFANTFYATSNIEGANSNLGTAVGAATGIEFFTNQIKNMIPTDKFDFGINYRPKGDMTSNELELSLSAPLFEDKLYIDVEGSYNFLDNVASVASNNVKEISGDFYLTWVIDDSGNLQLKGFSRTIDTFDENQGLQESGVGIYYKASFNSLSDLIARYKKYWADRPQRRKEREIERKLKKDKKTKEHQ